MGGKAADVDTLSLLPLPVRGAKQQLPQSLAASSTAGAGAESDLGRMTRMLESNSAGMGTIPCGWSTSTQAVSDDSDEQVDLESVFLALQRLNDAPVTQVQVGAEQQPSDPDLILDHDPMPAPLLFATNPTACVTPLSSQETPNPAAYLTPVDSIEVSPFVHHAMSMEVSSSGGCKEHSGCSPGLHNSPAATPGDQSFGLYSSSAVRSISTSAAQMDTSAAPRDTSDVSSHRSAQISHGPKLYGKAASLEPSPGVNFEMDWER